MTLPQADLDLANHVRAVMARARRAGVDEVETLLRLGVILTAEARKRIQREAVQEMLKDAERWRPAEYLNRAKRGVASTPKDMYDAILSYLRDYEESM